MKALLVSYLFPPVGGAGVARVLKLAKYLPDYGVEPTILTARNPSVPVIDRSRERDLPLTIRIVQAPTLEPGYPVKRVVWAAAAARGQGFRASVSRGVAALARSVLLPDPQLLWQPGAQITLARELRRERPDVVFISGPPFSQFLLALTARRWGAAVVLDYRDEWSLAGDGLEMRGRLARGVGRRLESLVLRRVHAVTTATEAFREALLQGFPFLEPGAVHAIPNGFDPVDFPSSLPSPPADRFVVTYAGTVFKLTSARGLLAALRRLQRDQPDLARLLEVRFLGRIVETEQEDFRDAEALGVRQVGYVEHGAALEALASSHANLCLLSDVPGAERIYPQKVFELMYLRRPILALSPPGALADLIRRFRVGEVFAPGDEAAIASWLAAQLQAFRDGRYSPVAAAQDITAFDRRALAGRFAQVFRAVRGPAAS